MNGVQTVFDLMMYEDDFLVLDGFIKAGVYHNRVRARVSETFTPIAGDSSVYGRVMNDSTDTVAFIGGVALNGAIKVSETVRITAGWEVLFLNNVALATDQARGLAFNAAGASVFNAVLNGNVIANGGKVGLLVVY